MMNFVFKMMVFNANIKVSIPDGKEAEGGGYYHEMS